TPGPTSSSPGNGSSVPLTNQVGGYSVGGTVQLWETAKGGNGGGTNGDGNSGGFAGAGNASITATASHGETEFDASAEGDGGNGGGGDAIDGGDGGPGGAGSALVSLSGDGITSLSATAKANGG